MCTIENELQQSYFRKMMRPSGEEVSKRSWKRWTLMGNKNNSLLFNKLLNIIFGNKKTKRFLPDVHDILASAAVLHDGVVFPLYRERRTDTKSNKPRITAIIQNRRYRESVRQWPDHCGKLFPAFVPWWQKQFQECCKSWRESERRQGQRK